MTLAFVAVAVGLALLVWSADRFVEGAASTARHFGIALILGLTALICPIAVNPRVLRRELVILTAVTALAAWQLRDGDITRRDAVVLLVVFGVLMGGTIWQGLRRKTDVLEVVMVSAT